MASGRLKKADKWAPADSLRIRAWARAIKQSLLPNSDPVRPFARLVETALSATKEFYQSDADKTLSPGRWSEWWNGTAMPSYGYQSRLNRVVPGSIRWLRPQLTGNRMQRHLFALDVVAMGYRGEGDENSYLHLLEILLKINNDWKPDFDGRIPVPGPNMPPYMANYFSKNELLELGVEEVLRKFRWRRAPEMMPSPKLSEEILEQYNHLEPTTIFPFMMDVGAHTDFIDYPGMLDWWVLDVITAGIVIAGMVHLLGLGESHIERPGFIGGAMGRSLNLIDELLYDDDTFVNAEVSLGCENLESSKFQPNEPHNKAPIYRAMWEEEIDEFDLLMPRMRENYIRQLNEIGATLGDITGILHDRVVAP